MEKANTKTYEELIKHWFIYFRIKHPTAQDSTIWCLAEMKVNDLLKSNLRL
jgi:hypothetical protein